MAAAYEAAARSDLPSAKVLSAINCPALVLAREDDPIHPVECARDLAMILGTADLRVARTAQDVRNWSNTITEFVRSTG
jgi:pimeloyl-ACP methyl ester carboxylesterase